MFSNAGYDGYFWCSNANNTTEAEWNRGVLHEYSFANRALKGLKFGFSVRLVKD
jgi:hypothetical protein